MALNDTLLNTALTSIAAESCLTGISSDPKMRRVHFEKAFTSTDSWDRPRDWALGSSVISAHEWSATTSKYKMAAKIRGVLVDLSGTIHVENTVIPGSIEALKRYIGSIRIFCHFKVLILKSNARLQ